MSPERTIPDSDTKTQECRECGGWFRSLAKHNIQIHSAKCIVKYPNEILVEAQRDPEDGCFRCQFCGKACSTVSTMGRHARQCDGSEKDPTKERPWVPWVGKIIGEDDHSDMEEGGSRETPIKKKSQKHQRSSSSHRHTLVKAEKGSSHSHPTVKAEKKHRTSRPAPITTFLEGLRRPLGHFSGLFSELGFDDMDDVDVLRYMPDEWELLGEDLKAGGMKLLEWMVVKEGLKKRFKFAD